MMVVVDLDPQANATAALRPGPTSATIADVLDEPRRSVVRAAIGVSAWSRDLHVLVGSESNERHSHPDPSAKRLERLDRALHRVAVPSGEDEISERYRLVIIDSPPSLGQLTRSALAAADRAILVAEPTVFAVAGVQRAFEAVQDERIRGNTRLQPLGVVLNRVRARSVEQTYRMAELQEMFGPLLLTGAIPDRSAIQQAQGAGVPIQTWNTPGAREVSKLFDSLLGQALVGRTRQSEPAKRRR
jgi:cellulose biosynthesis protein BcsQ